MQQLEKLAAVSYDRRFVSRYHEMLSVNFFGYLKNKGVMKAFSEHLKKHPADIDHLLDGLLKFKGDESKWKFTKELYLDRVWRPASEGMQANLNIFFRMWCRQDENFNSYFELIRQRNTKTTEQIKRRSVEVKIFGTTLNEDELKALEAIEKEQFGKTLTHEERLKNVLEDEKREEETRREETKREDEDGVDLAREEK